MLKVLFPQMISREPPYEEAIGWLQFYYTGDKKG